ncbi:MAG: cob(I)yrinic acid a,c-diamide adenosyltransferase [Candidatus Micrarchaeia archaeon]
MSVYTRTGDSGETSLYGGRRVKKYSPLISAYGTIDELSSWLGVCRSACGRRGRFCKLLRDVQVDLYHIGAHVAGAEQCISENRITEIEREIDKIEKRLPPLNTFILPSGTALAAHLHFARAVCRRAERELAPLLEKERKYHTELKYLNRLSDLLFVLARDANSGRDEKIKG